MRWRSLLALVTGIILGAAAGLIGVGGGEFRIPALWYLLQRRVRVAASVNLVVGSVTVIVSLARRWGTLQWSVSTIELAAVLLVASIAGAVIGARKANVVATPVLKRVVQGYLVIVGVWMLYEAITETERILLRPEGVTLFTIVAVLAFLIAAFSAAVGVAGGELRIPALLYLCAIPLKQAGTLSLVASIPTVVSGAIVYRQAGHLEGEALWFAVWMSAGSIAGVLIGAHFLGTISPHMLKAIFGGILLAAAIALGIGKE